MVQKEITKFRKLAPRIRNFIRVASGILMALGYKDLAASAEQLADPAVVDLAMTGVGAASWAATEFYYEVIVPRTGGAT